MTHRAFPSSCAAARRCRPAGLLLLACFAALAFGAARAESNLELRSLAASCAACHGTDGHSLPGSPLASLAHLPPAYFVDRMRAYRDDATLASSVMAQIAKGYDDHQVEMLADYFASQP